MADSTSSVPVAGGSIPFPVYFSELAANYAKQTGNSTENAFAASLDDILGILPITPGSRIHDNAAGPGTATAVLVNRIPAATLTAVRIHITDNVPAMLTAAREIFSALIPSIIEVQEMDSLNLTLPDNSISHSILNFSIFNMADPLKCLQEIYRTLQPGGVAALLTWQRFGAGEIMRAAQRIVRPDLPPIPFPHEEFTQEGVLADTAVAAGFDRGKVLVQRKRTVVAGEDLADLRSFFTGIIAEPAKKGWSDEEKARWPAAIESAIQAETELYGGVLFEAFVVLARKEGN